MKNLTTSEPLKTFDERRSELMPYGLTCEQWTPHVMRQTDRHNEIELNYFPEGNMTYLIQSGKANIPARRLAVFWGLVPHQIIHHEGDAPYYVCTIPFAQFLSWQLPASFADRILKGEVLLEPTDEYAPYDQFLLGRWLRDIHRPAAAEVILAEMHGRLRRMADNLMLARNIAPDIAHTSEISSVERIAIYIAQNYRNPIKITEVTEAAGLNPDYANSLFKKTFGYTLSEYIAEERIADAQRRLVLTDDHIIEIAYECGFNSISRFNSAFLKISGCTPREYRRRSRSKNNGENSSFFTEH